MLRERFEPAVIAAGSGGLDDWASTARGRLALILLTDQLPRNIYRDTPDAFRLDPLARRLCCNGLERGDDRELRPIERVFFYLPLEHSENLDNQNRFVQLLKGLVAAVEPALTGTFEDFLDYGVRHRDVIARFGRFPHRNRILGRESTSKEREFLTQPGSSF